LAKALPKPVLAIIDVTLIIISIFGLAFSAVSINLIIDQQSEANSPKCGDDRNGCNLASFGCLPACSGLNPGLWRVASKPHSKVTAPRQAAEEAEMGLFGKDVGDGERGWWSVAEVGTDDLGLGLGLF
jgi:hypothetical protein